MGRDPAKKRTSVAEASARKFVVQERVLTRIETLDLATADAAKLVAEINKIHSGLNNLATLVGFAIEAAAVGSPARTTWQEFRKRIAKAKKDQKSLAGIASHREKRLWVNNLGFNTQGRPLADFIANQPGNHESSSLHQPRIVYHPDIVIDSNPEYFCDVQANESVIFLRPEDNHIELFALRGLAMDLPYSEKLYAFLAQVIATACDERRDVRPNHPGKMVQSGCNAGQRDARVFGRAKAYTRNLTQETKIHHDKDTIAGMTIFWYASRTAVPTEVITAITEAVGEIGLPTISTRNVAEGTGYTFTVDGKHYNFPLHERAPCEAIFSQNYSAPIHRDPSYAPFTLSWTIERQLPEPATSQPQLSQPGATRVLRSSSMAVATEDPALWPSYGGGNFELLEHCWVTVQTTTMLQLAF
ncbi:hypothetical protein MSAN_00923900 [Mycena sanguinolenta]|uniref:Uncharacterized protein n=1 Tax=Mycena sanguinolenta TaxID=230812 RepID=A0A8H6YT29_9AGAR|nr:hypothetical protein MSAN_00923900 [Mycena sanguinolenta]